MSGTVLSTSGTLWTWTVQRVAPKSPPFVAPEGGFEPFAVGYVELPEGVRVMAVLDVPDLASLRIGMPLRIGVADGVPRASAVERTAGTASGGDHG
ncbi:Zn-ribbon domain-containing OB-fold protein [Saccharopolyspora erythraea]|uniref:Zn-ribbon domain-containing OB-fold protein n=1 Tax=Saccharopolyspora erythraea TaxID=1836 RepID=UPI002013AB06|nr:OB-fold domain-containing protein [Saccharopolyspora erythraea]